VGLAHSGISLAKCFLDVLELPSLVIKVGVHRLIEQKAAVAGQRFSKFIKFDDLVGA
jgi:hypothetical protein